MTTRAVRFNAGRATLTALSHGGMVILVLLFLFPFFWMVSNALKTDAEVFSIPPKLFPSTPLWENFGYAWSTLPFARFFFNSALVAGSVTLIVLTVSTLAGYAFARLNFRGSGSLFLLYLSTLMVPQAVIVIPLFLMMTWLGWVNTFQGLIVPMAFSSFGTFLMRQFFLNIPKELEEAALVDGASHLKILVRIFVPMARPALGLLALFTFTGQWNSFLWPLILVNDQSTATIPVGLTFFQGQQGTSWNYMMAGATISMLPGLAITVLLHRYIFSGIAINSGFGGR